MRRLGCLFPVAGQHYRLLRPFTMAIGPTSTFAAGHISNLRPSFGDSPWPT